MKKEKTPRPDVSKHHFLSFGNAKLPKTCAIFNLLAVEDCPNCETCKDSCYAIWRQCFSTVRNHREINSWFAHFAINELADYITEELKAKGDKVQFCRIHEAGDFISEPYFIMWHCIAERLPNIKFFSMTKVPEALKLFRRLPKLNNFNIMDSMPDGLRNYGSEEYCDKLCKEHGCFKCPDVDHSDICLVQCKYCTKGSRPCYVIHGSRKGCDKYETSSN
jgi:hypothetical protein